LIDLKNLGAFPFSWCTGLDSTGVSKNPLYSIIDWGHSEHILIGMHNVVYILNPFDSSTPKNYVVFSVNICSQRFQVTAVKWLDSTKYKSEGPGNKSMIYMVASQDPDQQISIWRK